MKMKMKMKMTRRRLLVVLEAFRSASKGPRATTSRGRKKIYPDGGPAFSTAEIDITSNAEEEEEEEVVIVIV
ncbi:hypothetical protein M0804_014002 [Polistes exclamans]|nr:hypothetical protein M0804_014004 [Polistes exclamans]KAI4475921.1 hypothetical protein M0804_014002 [Polistes exclamans]